MPFYCTLIIVLSDLLFFPIVDKLDALGFSGAQAFLNDGWINFYAGTLGCPPP